MRYPLCILMMLTPALGLAADPQALADKCFVDKESTACFEAGSAYFSGEGTSRNIAKSLELFVAGSSYDDEMCSIAAMMLQHYIVNFPDDIERHKDYMQDVRLACEDGSTEDCSLFNKMTEYDVLSAKTYEYDCTTIVSDETKELINANTQKTMSARIIESRLGQLCMNNDAAACVFLSEMKYDDKKFKRALSLAQKACTIKEGRGCKNVGNYYETGTAGDKDLKRATAYYKKACDLNYAVGCYNLGRLYLKGDGVEMSGENAEHYLKKGCSLEDEDSCYTLATSYNNYGGATFPYANDQVIRQYYGLSCILGKKEGCREFKTFSNTSDLMK
ncbi:MAG: tetratricopeptide repeat protein [Succinivibrio sp.]